MQSAGKTAGTDSKSIMGDTASTIEVLPRTVHIGAEIHGVDLTRPMSEEQVRIIRAALLQWKVVFFRDQHLTHAQHIEFARCFGDPTPARLAPWTWICCVRPRASW